MFEKPHSAEQVKEICKKYIRPKNVDNVSMPRVNGEIWSQLSRLYKTIDTKHGSTQFLVTKAAIAIMSVMANLSAKKAKTTRKI